MIPNSTPQTSAQKMQQKQQMFSPSCYKFIQSRKPKLSFDKSSSTNIESPFSAKDTLRNKSHSINPTIKTYLECPNNSKLSQLQLILLTNKLIHPNLINLRKIAKSKHLNDDSKGKGNCIYWLYYENVKYSLFDYMKNLWKKQSQINTPSQKITNIIQLRQELISVLLQIKNILKRENLGISLEFRNIWVTEDGTIKVYIMAQQIIERIKKVRVNTKSQIGVRLQQGAIVSNEKLIEGSIKQILKQFDKKIKDLQEEELTSSNNAPRTPTFNFVSSKSPLKKVPFDRQKTISHNVQYQKQDNIHNKSKDQERYQERSIYQKSIKPSESSFSHANNVRKRTGNGSIGAARFEKIRQDLEKIRKKVKNQGADKGNSNNKPTSNEDIKTKAHNFRDIKLHFQQNKPTIGGSPMNFHFSPDPQHGPIKNIPRINSQDNIFKATTSLTPKPFPDKTIKNQEHHQVSINQFRTNQKKCDKIQQQNINCINIYHHTNQILKKNDINPHIEPPIYKSPIVQKKPAISPPYSPPNKHYRSYDQQSDDTYQMEMGQDFQMPSLVANRQKLRQTMFGGTEKWDTLTTRNRGKNLVNESKDEQQIHPEKSNDTLSHHYQSPKKSKNKVGIIKNNKMVHESAGHNFFSRFIENNKAEIVEQTQKDDQVFLFNRRDREITSQARNLENKTNYSLYGRNTNRQGNYGSIKKKQEDQWQYATIKSASPGNIQDRVRQALMKTRNVMSILKNPKSSSLGK